MAKRVAVIGAGPSGLATVKALLEEGHAPVGFERAPSVGGVFRFDEADGVVWESCRLTSSGLLTAFSDFPVPAARAEHMTARQYVAYLGAYGEAFGVMRHIRFGTTVRAVTRSGSAGWSVRSAGPDGERDEPFDAVAVCSGLHQHPHVPRFPGQETFAGTVMHGAEYRRGGQVAGKKVLIVGAGESGADIVAEVAEHAAETVLSLRRGVAVVSRRSFGRPRDYQTSRILNSAAHWIFQTRNPKDDGKRNVYRAAFLPLVVVDKGLQLLYRFFWEFLPLLYSTRRSAVRANLDTRKMTMRLLEESGGTVAEQFGTKDDEFVRAIAIGKCRRAVAVDRFEGSSVVFADGTRFEPDLVILCTGFDTRMPFLDEAVAAAPRYLHTFNPDVGESLGFVGFLRPAFGAIPPLAELQARWFALVQSGQRRLPSRAEMQASIEHWTRVSRATSSGRCAAASTTWWTTRPFCDELASRIGCKPAWADLRRERLSFRVRFFAAPFVAAQYRLLGPHARPELAREMIAGLPVVHPLPDLINLYLRWRMSRALHRVLGARVRAQAGAGLAWPPRVSVVVPTRNRRAALGRALASVEAQTYRDLEVVVVDDASTDGTAAWLSARFPAIRVVSPPERGGRRRRPKPRPRGRRAASSSRSSTTTTPGGPGTSRRRSRTSMRTPAPI